MKNLVKLIALILALACAAALVGCKTEPKSDEKPVDMTGKPFRNDFDMALVIGGKTYPVRVDSKEVLEALGSDYKYAETISCVYEGYDKTFTYEGIVVSTVPVDDKDVIEMFSVTGGDYKTTRGIGIGASREEVVKAYGENFFDDGWYVTYTESGDPEKISEMRIQFRFVDDVLTEFYVYSPSYSD